MATQTKGRSRKSPPLVSSLVGSQKSFIPVFRIQRSVSRLNALRTSTLGCRASSATRPGSSICSSHPAERAAVSTSTHCSAPQSFPGLSTAQPADTVYNSALTALLQWSPFVHESNVCRTSLRRLLAATISKEKHL
jgi:hypothetical protein